MKSESQLFLLQCLAVEQIAFGYIQMLMQEVKTHEGGPLIVEPRLHSTPCQILDDSFHGNKFIPTFLFTLAWNVKVKVRHRWGTGEESSVITISRDSHSNYEEPKTVSVIRLTSVPSLFQTLPFHLRNQLSVTLPSVVVLEGRRPREARAGRGSAGLSLSPAALSSAPCFAVHLAGRAVLGLR